VFDKQLNKCGLKRCLVFKKNLPFKRSIISLQFTNIPFFTLILNFFIDYLFWSNKDLKNLHSLNHMSYINQAFILVFTLFYMGWLLTGEGQAHKKRLIPFVNPSQLKIPFNHFDHHSIRINKSINKIYMQLKDCRMLFCSRSRCEMRMWRQEELGCRTSRLSLQSSSHAQTWRCKFPHWETSL